MPTPLKKILLNFPSFLKNKTVNVPSKLDYTFQIQLITAHATITCKCEVIIGMQVHATGCLRHRLASAINGPEVTLLNLLNPHTPQTRLNYNFQLIKGGRNTCCLGNFFTTFTLADVFFCLVL